MTHKPENHEPDAVELPGPTAAPLIVSLGLLLAGAGLLMSMALLAVGLVVTLVGLGIWLGHLAPGQGHVHEPLAPPEERPQPIEGAAGMVEPMRPGMPGYRFYLPEKVHPISSGIKGGILGGLVMPIPALLYGIITHGSPWLPINLLAGMVVPDIMDASLESLKQFSLSGLVVGIVIHAIFAVGFGLMYGVILPTLPPIPGGPIVYGGVLMPILWSGICHSLMGIVNPLLERHVSWRWFIASQLVYGLVMSYVVFKSEMVSAQPVVKPER